jgi:hypothetical protein
MEKVGSGIRDGKKLDPGSGKTSRIRNTGAKYNVTRPDTDREMRNVREMYRSHMAGPDSDKEMRNVKWWTEATSPVRPDWVMREVKRGGQESRDRSDLDKKKREVKY